ncbi:hypothetical protein GPECTOR_5g65 [Gonium pectorale]|uniref:Uncharacterized protein n=1 Tax=Gonium pectorale TaxID=33097 RepID=A0A150GYL1_GONPE|nr:hypothetical protein GPECTOR_5g65 [Gonium pectorale]|eukprot:KXZ54410.1 hypothetical protein GPECTOR_5g65 [Gonium pectorale]
MFESFAGPVPWLAIFGMASGIAAAFFPQTRSLPIISQSFTIGVAVFRSVFGLQVVMGAAIVAHLVETAITANICARNKVSSRDTLGWCGIALLIGYGAIHELNGRLRKRAA